MGIRTVIIASCDKGCTEMRTFRADERDDAKRWLMAHERTHDEPRVYIGKHDPEIQARF